jgi:hypothetical protein
MHRLFLAVSQQQRNSLIFIGGLASAATTGALVAMGRRLGSAGIPFAAIGAPVFHRTASSAAVGLVAAGVLLHVLAIFVWTALFIWLTRRRPDAAPWIAIAVASGAFVFSRIVAWATGVGLSSVLPLGDRLVLALVLAGALVLGMRFAFFRRA